jgi:transposase
MMPVWNNSHEANGMEAALDSIAVVSLDIHKKFSKAVALAWDGAIVEESRIPHGDRRDMRAFFARFQPGTDVVMEATFNWPWVADAAEEVGMRPHLAHPTRLREYAKGLPKTDRKDAVFQGKLWLAGDIFPESYRAPVPVRRMRALFRLRLLWIRMRTMLKNNAHGQLFKLGLLLDTDCTDLFSAKGREILERLPLQPSDREEIERKLVSINHLTEQIDKMDREIAKRLRKDKRATLLKTIPGIGEKSAYAVLAEVGEFSRFPNGRALASYAGLLPVPRESAGREYERHTSPASNRFLRWALLETVTGAVRSSRRMASLHARVRARNPKHPNKARVAVARQVAELSHLLVTRGLPYKETQPVKARRQPRRRQT